MEEDARVWEILAEINYYRLYLVQDIIIFLKQRYVNDTNRNRERKQVRVCNPSRVFTKNKNMLQ